MNLVCTNISWHYGLVWWGTREQTILIQIVSIFMCHNQCGGGGCLPSCVQLVLYAYVVINIKMQYMPLKIVVTSRANKLKSGMGKHRSISRQGL